MLIVIQVVCMEQAVKEDRANNVANELVKLGVNKNNLIISGMGGVNTLTLRHSTVV